MWTGHTTSALLTPTYTMSITDKITIFCNDVNKTETSVNLMVQFGGTKYSTLYIGGM